MVMELKIGTQIIRSYKRLSYSPWHALAEFVDNSIQSYLDNQAKLDGTDPNLGQGLTVDIRYSRADGGLLAIRDNAMGMSDQELTNALSIGTPPAVTTGLSEFGLGLKTAACWFGDYWTVRTKKRGTTTAHFVEFDVERVAEGFLVLPYQEYAEPEENHYTEITIHQLNHQFHGRLISKTKLFLGSMYRSYIGDGSLTLLYNGEPLSWASPTEGKNIHEFEGKPCFEEFAFQIGGKEVHGWIAVMERGSRSNAGLTMIRRNRVIKGWPESWRPQSIFGQLEGTNDLVNQRLVGEVNLDGFGVSHTKDDILWEEEEEDELEHELYRIAEPYVRISQSFRKRGVRQDPPGRSVVNAAMGMLGDELHSDRLRAVLSANGNVPRGRYETMANPMIEAVTRADPRGTYPLHGLTLNVFVSDDLSDRDPYLGVEIASDDILNVVINMNHPHVRDINGKIPVLNYLKACTFEGIAQWKAEKTWDAKDPSLLRAVKDSLFRIGQSMKEPGEE